MSGRGSRTNSYVKSKDRPVIRFRLKAAVFIAAVVFAVCFVIYMAEANLN